MSLLRAGAALFAILSLEACGCAKGRDGWEEGRPKIEALEFLQAVPGDPSALEFSIDFSDSDGDLAGGTLHMFANDAEVASLGLAEVFAGQVPPLDPSSKSGQLDVVVRLRDTLATGQRVKIGFVLDDGKGSCPRSNEPYVVLEATMMGTAAAGRGRALAWAEGACPGRAR